MGSPHSGVHLTYNRNTNLEIHNPQIHLLSAAEAKLDATFPHTCPNTHRETFKPSLRAHQTGLQVETGDDSLVRPSPPTVRTGTRRWTQRGKPRASVDDGSAEKTWRPKKETRRKSGCDDRKWIKGCRGEDLTAKQTFYQTEIGLFILQGLVSRRHSLRHHLFNMLWKSHDYITFAMKQKKTH